MASYNLACAAARAGRTDQATAALREAIALNPAVRANAIRDPDLATLRAMGLAELAPVTSSWASLTRPGVGGRAP
jgi:hypothetical protein